MKPLNKQTTDVFHRLIEDLTRIGDHRKIDNCHGAFMPVSVEVVGRHENPVAHIVAVTHYYEQEGDLVTDPEVTFMVTAKGVFPMTFEQGGVCYRVLAKFEDGKLRYNEAGQADLAGFCDDWMMNIREQQDL